MSNSASSEKNKFKVGFKRHAAVKRLTNVTLPAICLNSATWIFVSPVVLFCKKPTATGDSRSKKNFFPSEGKESTKIIFVLTESVSTTGGHEQCFTQF